jgi:hypothetical protein
MLRIQTKEIFVSYKIGKEVVLDDVILEKFHSHSEGQEIVL